jgi:peptidoglycan/xylan/chitin deacetylase (PgdA/CDA1 family)
MQWKNFLKESLFWLYLHCGYVPLRDGVRSMLGRSRVVVLCYHRIGKQEVVGKTRQAFREDLAWLKKHYECIGLSEFCGRLREGRPMRRRTAIVTFDDGYLDNYTHAVPELMAAGMTATFFVATGYIGTDRIFPHDQKQGEDYPKLTWEGLRAMGSEGFEIGSHTVEHANLGCVDESTMRRELSQSLEMLNCQLSWRQRAFAFPWGKPGDMPEAARRIASQLGYYAVASACGGVNSRGTDPMNIRRVDAGNGFLSRRAWQARVCGLDPDYLRYALTRRRV